MENKLQQFAEEFNETFLDLPVTHKVGDLILNPDLSFEEHIKRLIKLDKINDANAKLLHKSPQHLLAWINSFNEFEKAYYQLHSFLNMAQKEHHEDTFEKYYKLWVKANKAIQKVDIDVQKVVFANKNKIKKYLESPLLQPYARWFKLRFFGDEKHQIDDYESRAIKEIGGTTLIDRLYRAAMYGDADWDDAKDSHDQTVKFATEDEYFQCEDPIVGMTFWRNYTLHLLRKMNTLSELISVKILRTLQYAKFKEFKTIHNMIMHDFEIAPIVGDKIFKVCKRCQHEFALFVNYNDNVARIQTGAKDVFPWTRRKGPKFTQTAKISQQEAQEDILAALSVLGPEYQSLVKKVFDEKWIDWHWAKEQGTNFSCACPGNCKYPIKVDFTGSPTDVIVLAHEIGHSLNAELNKKNGVYQGNTPVLSEVPSFVNETLMFLYYLNKKYKNNERQEELTLAHYMMSRLYNNICENCIYQITVNELEKEFIETRSLFFKRILSTFRRVQDEYGVLTNADLKWMKSKDMLGAYDVWNLRQIYGLIGDRDVMLYLLGATVGVCIALKIFNGDKELAKKYINFLKAGQAKNPISLLKRLGFDITKSETFDPLKNICRQLMSIIAKYVPKNPNEEVGQVEASSSGKKKLTLRHSGSGQTSTPTKKRKLVLKH